MMSKNKVAVIDGADGAIGSAVARAFWREGARLFLTGRHRVALVPKQMIAGTEIADRVSKMYAAKAGITQEKFMEGFGKPLTSQMVAQGILTIARGEGPAGPAVAIPGNSGLEAMG
jgi:NAD(P)-dependent dehydrogenase (short-subunit alcohol dehydrogenase family)